MTTSHITPIIALVLVGIPVRLFIRLIISIVRSQS